MKTGDKVVCVRTHSSGAINGVVKGKIFTILGTYRTSCGCVGFDVGVSARKGSSGYTQCFHGTRYGTYGVWVIGSDRFAPIVEDEFLSSDEIDKVVEEKIDTKIPIEA